MNWNFLQCLSSSGGEARTEECEISGHAGGQHIQVPEESGPLRWRERCLAPQAAEAVNYDQVLASCAVTVERGRQGVFPQSFSCQEMACDCRWTLRVQHLGSPSSIQWLNIELRIQTYTVYIVSL